MSPATMFNSFFSVYWGGFVCGVLSLQGVGMKFGIVDEGKLKYMKINRRRKDAKIHLQSVENSHTAEQLSEESHQPAPCYYTTSFQQRPNFFHFKKH